MNDSPPSRYLLKISRTCPVESTFGHLVRCTGPTPSQAVNVTRLGPGSEAIDLVITLGGDGTILHASSLFKSGAVPPVLSFSMGTLGFLLPFREGASGKSVVTFILNVSL